MNIAVPKKSEDAIHKEIVAWLRGVLPADAIIHHSRNEGNRGGRKGMLDGVRGKEMGVMAGFPDLLIYTDQQGYCIEVKAQGEYQSKIQKTVEHNLAVQGIPYAVCRSIDDVRAALLSWGVRTREVARWVRSPRFAPNNRLQ